MRLCSVMAAAATGLWVLLAQGVAANTAEVKLLAATPMRPVIVELGPRFERDTGHKLVAKFMSGLVVLKREIEAGETFDVAIAQPAMIDNLIKEGKIAAGTLTAVAYTGVGVGIRAGAPKPDIGSVEAFKNSLLKAKSVAHSAEGASGVHFKDLLERLGIAEQMKPKLKPLSGGALAQAVPRGEAEMVVLTMSTIMASGAHLVGPIPSELQFYNRFAAGIGTQAKHAEAAKALINLLTAPAAVPVIKAKGLEPGAPN